MQNHTNYVTLRLLPISYKLRDCNACKSKTNFAFNLGIRKILMQVK